MSKPKLNAGANVFVPFGAPAPAAKKGTISRNAPISNRTSVSQSWEDEADAASKAVPQKDFKVLELKSSKPEPKAAEPSKAADPPKAADKPKKVEKKPEPQKEKPKVEKVPEPKPKEDEPIQESEINTTADKIDVFQREANSGEHEHVKQSLDEVFAKEEAELLAEAAEEEAEEQNENAEAGTPASGDGTKKTESKQPEKIRKPKAEAKVHDEREHLNIVFIGHVDAGKSTISGQILLLTGQVDERTIQKYEKEAKEKNRESWYIAYIMDTNDEERERGKTVEVGRAHFTTTSKRYTILDAPGHKNYVPNMIGGATQADVGGLVISARKGEFESGFEKGGQTREHAMLAKTLGIQKVVVLVNKMDDPTVNWDQERYNDIVNQIGGFLKKWGYSDKDLYFLPVSGFTSANLKEPVSEAVCPWYKPRVSFFQLLDSLPPVKRDPAAPLRIPIMARYKDMGAIVILGKIESGTLRNGTTLIMMPTGQQLDVVGVTVDETACEMAKTGENVAIKIKGLEKEDDIHVGFVLSEIDRPVRKCVDFEAQIQVLDLLDHKPVLTAGYLAMFHVHTACAECEIRKLTGEMDKKTGQPTKKIPRFVKSTGIVTARIRLSETVAFECFKDFPQLGRFTLRDEGKTIGIGKVLNMVDAKATAAENQSGVGQSQKSTDSSK